MAEYCYLFLRAAPSDRSIFMYHKTTGATNFLPSKKAFKLIEPLTGCTSAPWLKW